MGPAPGPPAGTTLHPGPLRAMTATLSALLAEPSNLAALAGMACAVKISRLKALAVSIVIAAGLFYFGFPVHGTCVVASQVFAWLVHCIAYPRYKCRVCGGGGEFKTPFQFSTVAKECWWCKGDATKLRLGRRILKPILGDWRL
jgi:hypothetical protein